jgi:2-polyprenyl-3-methyl-5-hydroxy-6-metoxy-1,4-benzoquinol methylase
MMPISNAAKGSQPSVALSRVREFIIRRFSGRSIRIYEAGGGSLSILPLSSLTQPTITVVDIDETQLRNNRYAEVKILGDIQTYSFPPGSFELIVCNTVIEHLRQPDQAIKHFYEALAPGGLLFIGAPHPASLSGLVTKYSPHWFHVWFYKVALGRKNAGQPGQPPFRTVYHRIVHPHVLIDFCKALGFTVIHFDEVTGWVYHNVRERRPFIGQILWATVGMLNVFTFGRRDLRNGDYYAVFEKPVGTRGNIDKSTAFEAA